MMPNSNNPQTKTRIAAVLALAAALLVSAASPAAPPAKPQQDTPTITPNYKDADLSQIIQAVAEVTGKNFIIDPRVNAKVTMLSATPMSPAAFYEAFLSVLQVYGYVAVPAGKVIKIVPNTDARQLPANDLPASVSSSSDEIVTQIITVKNISAAQLVPILRPFVPQYGQLTAYPSGNMLIISDRASNVSRIVRIVERMDSSEDEPIEVIALHNASASDVVRVVNSINQGGQGAEGAGDEVTDHVDHVEAAAGFGEQGVDARLVGDVGRLHADVEKDDSRDEARHAGAEEIQDGKRGEGHEDGDEDVAACAVAIGKAADDGGRDSAGSAYQAEEAGDGASVVIGRGLKKEDQGSPEGAEGAEEDGAEGG